MNLLRQIFMTTDSVEISFNVQLEIVNGTNLSKTCDNGYYLDYRSFDTFCPSTNSSDYHWKLCYLPYEYGYNNLKLTFSSQTLSKREAERKRINTDVAISWLSLLHGNTLSYIFPLVILHPDIDPYDDDDYHIWVSMTLVMDTLDCNPPIPMTQCALSELLSWVCFFLFFCCCELSTFFPTDQSVFRVWRKTTHLGSESEGIC